MSKIFVVKQHDITDCGPACLSSIIKYYGGYVPIEVLRLKCQTNSEGTSAYNLIETAKSFNFLCKAVKVSNISELKSNYDLPCIVHLQLKNGLNHFAILHEIKKHEVILMDPAHGKIKMKKQEFFGIFTGIAIILSPLSTLVKYAKPNSISKTILSFFIDNRKVTIKLLILSIIMVIISIITNYFLKYGSLVSNGDFGLTVLTYLLFIYLWIYVLKNSINYIKNKLIIYMNKNISSDLYQRFSHQLFILPLNFIKSKTSGEIISRYNELSQINQMIPDIIISISLDLIMLIITLMFLSIISFYLSIISIIFMIIYTLVCIINKNPTLRRIDQNINYYSDFNTKIIDNVNTIVSTKYLNNEDNMEKRLEKSGSNYLYNNMKLELYFNKCELLKNVIFDLGNWFVISLGLYLCYIHKINIIDLFTYELVSNFFYNPIKELNAIIPKICYMKSSFYKLNEFALVKEEAVGTSSFVSGSILIKDLSFSYDNNYNILKNINLEIKKNEKILLQGESGSGKSTLCQILSKQLNYEHGEIKIGGININDFNINDYRKNITYIGQKDSLLVDTILKNIIYERNILDKDLKNICNICEIDEILDKKSNRLDTIINESSMNISGGEKQRIILARGLLNPGKIIILDEALSEVNKEMEERIIKRIINRFKNKTIIYVSHKEYSNLFNRRIILSS